MSRQLSPWSGAAATALMLAAVIGPIVVFCSRSIDRNSDASPGFIILTCLVAGVVLLVTFLPAIVLAALYSPTMRPLVISSVIVMSCTAFAYGINAFLPNSEFSLLVFPVAGLAAAVGAWTINVLD